MCTKTERSRASLEGGRPGLRLWARSKQKKVLKQLEKDGRLPKELDLKVDLKKVNWPVRRRSGGEQPTRARLPPTIFPSRPQVMKEWIAKRVTQLLGIEEEVLIGMIFNTLEDPQVRTRHSRTRSPPPLAL